MVIHSRESLLDETSLTSFSLETRTYSSCEGEEYHWRWLTSVFPRRNRADGIRDEDELSASIENNRRVTIRWIMDNRLLRAIIVDLSWTIEFSILAGNSRSDHEALEHRYPGLTPFPSDLCIVEIV